MTTENNTTRFRIVEALKAFPGSSISTIVDLVPGSNYARIKEHLGRMYRSGEVDRVKDLKATTIKKPYLYTLSDSPEPRVIEAKLKRSKPTESGLQAQLNEARAKIEELCQWQANAMERYPDLAVPTTVIQARKIVAEQLRAAKDHHGAEVVLAGKRDETMIIKAVQAALEQVA